MLHFAPSPRKAIPYGQSLPPIDNYEINYVNKPIKQKTPQQRRSTQPIIAGIPETQSSDFDFIQSIIKNGGTPLAFAEDLPTPEQEPICKPEPVVLVDKDYAYYKNHIKQMPSKDILVIKADDIEKYINQTFQIKNADLNKKVRLFFVAVYTSTYMRHLVDDSVVSHMAHCL